MLFADSGIGRRMRDRENAFRAISVRDRGGPSLFLIVAALRLGAEERDVFPVPAFLYFSYETQRQAIWLSYGFVGTSWPLKS